MVIDVGKAVRAPSQLPCRHRASWKGLCTTSKWLHHTAPGKASAFMNRGCGEKEKKVKGEEIEKI